MFFSHEEIATKVGVGFEFSITDSVDPIPTRHFLLLVLLENQIQYPIEFAVAQDHAISNPNFLFQGCCCW